MSHDASLILRACGLVTVAGIAAAAKYCPQLIS